MNKNFLTKICSLGLIVISTGNIHAEGNISKENNTNLANSSDLRIVESIGENTTVEFNGASLDLPYNIDDINISRKEYENKIEFTVRDKQTNEILNVFGEETLSVKENVYFKETKSIGTRYQKNLYSDFYKGPCTFRLNQPINYSTSGSFRWIDGAGKATLNQVTGGDWSLSSTNIANNWKGQHLTYIKTDAMTTVTVKTNSTIVGDFSKKSLQNAGYNVALTSSSGGVNYYTARWTPTKRFGFKWDIETSKYTIYNL